MDAARSGPLASVAELLRYEELAHSARETVTQLELINLKMDAAASFARAGQGDVTALFEQLGLVPPGVHNSLTAWHGSTFTGREWLQDQIDSFLSTNRRGYLVIEGEAGVGKSAFAIWLATCRGYVFHTTMFPGGKHQTAAIRSIARQLSTAYGLENIAAQDAYSPAAGQPSWLHHAINEAGLRRKHQTPDEPLVIVVDGLDEAESTVEPPLGLPQALPDGVFIIVTLRSGTPLRWIRENYGTFKLSRTSSANMDDMRHHIEAVEREPALKQLIHSAGIADSFSSDLMAACEGSWIYLRYVLDEIRTGRRSPLSLKNLPAGLWNFYTENVAKLRTDAQEWEKFFLPILAALASIEEPVTADALGVAAGIPHEGRRIETFLESSWRSFCNVNNSREYDLYHRSLHDYLVGAPATRTDAELEFSISDRLEFRRAVLECHIRLSDVYLEVWGGLQQSLPLLAAEAEAAHWNGEYGLRYLPVHLEAAGRIDEIHQLLACEHTSETASSAENLWYLMHQRNGTPSVYLDQIKRAEQLALYSADSPQSSRTRLPGLDLVIRYRLIQASLVSLASNLPPELLSALVRHKIWLPSQALTHIRDITDPEQRLRAVVLLYSELPSIEQAAILVASLNAAKDVENGWAAARAISTVVQKIAPELTGVILLEARRLSNSYARAVALGAIAKHMQSDERATIFAEALDAALESHFSCADALCALIPALPAALLADVLTRIRRLDSYPRLQVLAAIAPRLRPDLIDQALTIARSINDPAPKAAALGALALRIAYPNREWVIDEALDAVLAEPEEQAKVEALRALSPQLTSELTAKALSAISAINGDDYIAKALSEIAPFLTSELRPTAIAAARTIEYAGSRARTLCKLIFKCPETEQRGMLPEIMQALEDLPPGWSIANNLRDIAPILPMPLISSVMRCVRNIDQPYIKACALSALIPHLSAEFIDEVYRIIDSIEEEWCRADPLCTLATAAILPEEDRPQELITAFQAALSDTDEVRRSYLLGELLPFLPQQYKLRALESIFNAAHAIAFADEADHLGNEDRLGEIMTAMGPYLPPAPWPESLNDAFANSLSFDSGYHWLRIIGVISAYLPLAQLSYAITSAKRIRNHHDRIRAFGSISAYLDTRLLRTALTAALSVNDNTAQADLICGLAAHVAENDRPVVHALALEMVLDDSQDGTFNRRSFSRLVPYLSSDLISSAFSRISSRQSSRVEAIVVLAPYLTPQLTLEALRLVRSPEGQWNRIEGLAALAPYMPPAQRYDIYSEVTAAVIPQLDKYDSHFNPLIFFAPNLPADLLSHLLDACLAVEPGWRKANYVKVLAPFLTPPLVAKAFTVVCTMDESDRATGLMALAPYLTSDLLEQAIQKAETISYYGSRYEALCGLAPYIPEPDRQRLIDTLLAEGLSARTGLPDSIQTLFANFNDVQFGAVLRAMRSSSFLKEIYMFGALAPYLPKGLFGLALTVVRDIEFELSRAASIANLAPYLPASEFPTAIRICNTFIDPKHRSEAVAAIGMSLNRLDAAERTDLSLKIIYGEMLYGMQRESLMGVLSAMSSEINYLGDAQSCARCVTAVMDVARWWP